MASSEASEEQDAPVHQRWPQLCSPYIIKPDGLHDHYTPIPQSYYAFHDRSQEWLEVPPNLPTTGALPNPKLRVMTWNIDSLIGGREVRMAAGLNYMGHIIYSSPSNLPVVLLLQEMTYNYLVQIRECPWIRQQYFVTDLFVSHWGNEEMGTVAVVDKRLIIERVFRVPWISRYGRDGLFTDLKLQGTNKVLRLCNVHLESLVAIPPLRPGQVAAASVYLHEDEVEGGVMAGDLNAIEPFDRTLHSDNQLLDAYLELGGEEDSEEGYTWGYQSSEATRSRFKPSRMDKVLYCGGLRATTIERFGMDVKVPEEYIEGFRQRGIPEWVTDHYGLMVDLELSSAALQIQQL